MNNINGYNNNFKQMFFQPFPFIGDGQFHYHFVEVV